MYALRAQSTLLEAHLAKLLSHLFLGSSFWAARPRPHTRGACGSYVAGSCGASPARPTQHPDEDRPAHPVHLDQELGIGATLRVAPELSDPVGSPDIGSIRTCANSAPGAILVSPFVA